MADEIELDHLAVASESGFEQFARYYGDLGGTPEQSGIDPGFFFWQVKYPGGMKIEMLQDDPTQSEDFLRRFLDRNGPGPHHLTFKVPDLVEMLKTVEAAGYEPVGVELDNPDWQQAFLHPKEGPGVVIQMACTLGGDDESESAGQSMELGHDGFPLVPMPRCEQPADLIHVCLLVADVERELALFTSVLGGAEVGRGTDDIGDFIDLRWPNDTALRLQSPTQPAAVQWMGREKGRVHHALFRVDDIGHLPAVRRLGAGRYELAPEHNLGLRLHLETGA